MNNLKKDEEKIKISLMKTLKEITEKKTKNIIFVNRVNSKKITITTKYNIDKFGLAPGQFIQIRLGSDLRFSYEKICICVGVNLWGKKKLWFLTEKSDGITFFTNKYNYTDKEFFFHIKEEGSLVLLEPITIFHKGKLEISISYKINLKT